MARFRSSLILAALLLGAGASARAQMESGLGVGPNYPFGPAAVKPGAEVELTPMAVALSLAFDATTWYAVGVSTEAPAQDLAKLLLKGCYRLELLQLTLMAQRAGRKLPDLVEKRNQGDTLRKIATDLATDYDRVYEDSAALSRDVERSLETVSRIRDFSYEKKP
jgi:hypothetical protein